MFNKLFGFQKKRQLMGIFPLWLMILAALFAIGGVAVLGCLAITELGKHGIATDLVLLAAVFVCVFAAAKAGKDEETEKSGYKGKEPIKKAVPKKVRAEYLDTFSELPHFERRLDKEKVMGIIKNASFSPYVTRDGVELGNVLISDDDKWVCILGGYMPVDLICGYNSDKNVIYTIDDHEIELPRIAKTSDISMDINTFFDDRGIFYTSMPENAFDRFIDSTENKYYRLDEADFSQVRYKWEKAGADMNSNKKGSIYHPVMSDGTLCQDIFERVLSAKEQKKTENAVRKKEIKLSEYLDFKAYKNEFSVCNTIAVLKKLGYPDNEEGLDFLFDCLRDVDEAYFLPAIDVIRQFPGKMLQEKLEEGAKRAYESYDVVGLAGLMYLAKKIQYKIKYVENIRQNQTNADSQAWADDVNQVQQEAPLSFSFDGMAYQDQL